MTRLSITTDYCVSVGDPEPYIRLIAGAGFSHLHWSHNFLDDHLYSASEFREIRAMLKKFRLRVLDVHGSLGRQCSWCSLAEEERRAGVGLVKNRAELLVETEGEGVLIMHSPAVYTSDTPEEVERRHAAYRMFVRSMDELLPELERMGVVLALENMPNDTWELLESSFKRYPAERVGLCYDSGHGNICRSQLEQLEHGKSRLRALHLNDNNGIRDLHQSPGMGTVAWERLADIIASSAYTGPMSYEITMRATPFTVTQADGTMAAEQPESSQKAFLRDAFRRCGEFSALVAARRKNRLFPDAAHGKQPDRRQCVEVGQPCRLFQPAECGAGNIKSMR